MKISLRSNHTECDRPNYRILLHPKNTGELLKDLEQAGCMVIFSCLKIILAVMRRIDWPGKRGRFGKNRHRETSAMLLNVKRNCKERLKFSNFLFQKCEECVHVYGVCVWYV